MKSLEDLAVNPAFLLGMGILSGNRAGQPVGQADPIGSGLKTLMSGMQLKSQREAAALDKTLKDLQIKAEQRKLQTADALAKIYQDMNGANQPTTAQPTTVQSGGTKVPYLTGFAPYQSPSQPTTVQSGGKFAPYQSPSVTTDTTNPVTGQSTPSDDSAMQVAGNPYLASLYRELDLSKKYISSGDPTLVAQGRASQQELLKAIDDFKRKPQYIDQFTDELGNRIGWDVSDQRLENIATGDLYDKPVPKGYKHPDVIAQEKAEDIRKKELERTGWQTITGVDDETKLPFTQRVYVDPTTGDIAEYEDKIFDTSKTYVPDGDGGVRPVKGGSEDPSSYKNITGEMRKNASFANIMVNADANINTSFNIDDPNNYVTPSKNVINYIGSSGEEGLFDNEVNAFWRSKLTPQEVIYADNALAWLAARVRKESGAQIAGSELAKDYRIFFAAANDRPEDVLRKRKMRNLATTNMIFEAAEAFNHPSMTKVHYPYRGKDGETIGIDAAMKEYNKLKKGDIFLDDDGLFFVKP